ncbi:phosphatase PAP2 family protein [Candidatus Gracilibacteria bacterium]|nr:phosphatase PAP2 family protein [Candidatus Gracilibacteria bacterium]
MFPLIETYLRNHLLDKIAVFTTEILIYIVLFFFAVATIYRVWRNPSHKSKLVPAFFAFLTTGIFTYILKGFFHIERPFHTEHLEIIGKLNPLLEISSYSFPSAHTAISFSLLIPFWRFSKLLGAFWAIFALFIGFARIYENVHFPSDVGGGIFLGGVIGSFFSHPEIRKLIKLLWKDLEFRRQSFHFCTGFLCVFAHWAGFFRLRELAVLLILGLIISFFSQKRIIPVVSNILKKFDRPRDKDFPGRGAFYFFLSVFICLLIFPIKIAYSAILILSVGDSLNHLFTNGFQRIHVPWNRRKNLWGVLLGIAFGTFASQFFVPLIPAFVASTISIFAETFRLRIGSFYIDDNLFVPILAGIILIVLV